MSAPKGRDQLHPFEGFLIGLCVLGLVLQVLARDWEDLLDGAILTGFMYGYFSATHRIDFLERFWTR